MTSYVENETQQSFPFDAKALLECVAQAVLDSEIGRASCRERVFITV